MMQSGLQGSVWTGNNAPANCPGNSGQFMSRADSIRSGRIQAVNNTFVLKPHNQHGCRDIFFLVMFSLMGLSLIYKDPLILFFSFVASYIEYDECSDISFHIS